MNQNCDFQRGGVGEGVLTKKSLNCLWEVHVDFSCYRNFGYVPKTDALHVKL